MNIRQLKDRNRIGNESHHQQIEIRNNRESDQTIQRMLLIQVCVFFICSLANFAFRLYPTITLTTSKSNLRLFLENFIFNGILLIFYFEKIFSIYIYPMSSRHFRKILLQILTSICPHRTIGPEN